jgi:hypothetical protein
VEKWDNVEIAIVKHRVLLVLHNNFFKKWKKKLQKNKDNNKKKGINRPSVEW